METGHRPFPPDRPVRRPCERSRKTVPAPRLLVFDCFGGLDRRSQAALVAQGYEIVMCRDDECLVEAVVERSPDVVIFALRPNSAEELGVLRLLRRIAPEAALIVLAAEGSLEAQRAVQRSRPIYYAVCPVEPAEIREAVSDALARPRHGPDHGHRLAS
jgi:DNA-binding NtrC family response regulator